MDITPRGSTDPFNPSFWYVTDSMGYPEGTVAGGYGVPFEDAELVIIKHFYHRGIKHVSDMGDSFPGRKAVGVGMIGLGTAMLVPGPIDAIAYGAGAVIMKHPAGGAVGVAAYNLLAFGVIGAGVLISL